MTRLNKTQCVEQIIFFDGVCGLCSRFITFVFNHDKQRQFKFASLQSDSAAKMLNSQDLKLDTIIYLADGRVYHKSSAVLKILSQLGGLFKIVAIVALVLPKKVLDFFYTKIASNRYRLFGKSDTCRLPSAEEKRYFLD